MKFPAGAGATSNENTPLRSIAATSQQQNSLNQDLNGIGKTFDSSATWSQLGGFTNTMNATGVAAVPEPSASLIGGLGASLILLRRRRA